MFVILPEALSKWFITHRSRFRLWHDKKSIHSKYHASPQFITLYKTVFVSCLERISNVINDFIKSRMWIF